MIAGGGGANRGTFYPEIDFPEDPEQAAWDHNDDDIDINDWSLGEQLG